MDAILNNIELYLKASVVMSFAAAFAGGLVASFTPCVYPMIPITAGIIGNQNLGGSRKKGLVLSIVYVTGMAFTYACIGMFAALTGRLFGEINTNPFAFFIIANVTILMGLSMLDVFSIPVFSPKNTSGTGGLAGVFMIGVASGFVAGPCTAPVLGVLLAYVATTQSIIFGGSLLFVFAFGMGFLLILIGTFSGVLATLPKSGNWMVQIKKCMGVLMIGIGEYFLIKMGQLII